jgi:hypothetical protein
MLQSLALEIYTQSARIYGPDAKQPTRASAVLKSMERTSTRLSRRVEARDLVETGKADAYYRDKFSHGSGNLAYYKPAADGLVAWERSIGDMAKLIKLSNNGVDAIDSSAWFDTAKAINNSLRGELSNATDSLLGEPFGSQAQFKDLLTKEEHIAFLRDVLVGMSVKHDQFTQGIPATEAEARHIVEAAKEKILGLVERIDKRKVASDGTITGYTIYDLASKAEAAGQLPQFWKDQKDGLLTSLKNRADAAKDPALQKDLMALRGRFDKLFPSEFDAKLAEWQKRYTALKRDAVDATWYLLNEIKCYKLSIEEIVTDFRRMDANYGFSAGTYGNYSTLLLDSMLTALAGATERDV